MMTNIIDVIAHNKIIPIIDLPSVHEVLMVVEQLLAKNITTIELTLRNKEVAVAAAKEISRVFGSQLILGLGTIKTPDEFSLAVDCGAEYIVSPGITKTLLQKSTEHPHIPYLPGIITASEIMLALEFDIHHLKLFPAHASNGLSLLKSFYGPFKMVKFCATGGITFENQNDYLTQPNVFAVGMSKI